MALTRVVIPDLTGGVSRQPDSLRFPNQTQESDNTFIHFSTGLEKRRGSTYVKNITDPTGTLKIHWVERSATQRYFFMFKQDGTTPLYIYKADGTTCTITYDAGTLSALKTYLNTSPSNIRAVSFDDTTIVVNTSIVTAMDSATQSYLYPTSTGTAVDISSNAHNKASWEEFNLPPSVINEYWYAKDDALGHPSGWYKSISITSQPWYERVRTPMASSAFDAGTMPIKIVQTGDTAFTVSQIAWKPRYSGDGATNPPASFVGKTISDIALHRNRLWISAGENVVSSQAGDYFNFWYNSYTQLIDSDPIDIQLGSSQVSKINYIIPYNKSLVIFTNGNQQFELRAREALTPTTVSIVASTAYTSAELARPIIVGSQLYWSANKGAYTQLYEYVSDDAAAQSVATDISAHIENYISKNINFMSASSSGDIITIGTSDTQYLYVCFMYWQGDKKLQNSWGKWYLGDEGTILSCNVFADKVYIIQRVDGKLRISYIETRYTDAFPSYLPRIDCQRQVTGSWNKGAQETTFVTDLNLSIDAIYCGSEWVDTGNEKEGVWFEPTSVVDNGDGTVNVTVDGDWTAHPVWLGVRYTTDVELSRQYVRDRNSIPYVGTLQLRSASIAHRNTGYFEFQIDPDTTPASTRILTYTGKTIGSTFIASQNSLSTNEIDNFKIMGSSNGVTLSIVSSHPSPMNITSIEFATNFVEKKTSPADR